MQLSVSARSSNLVLIRFIYLEILRFLYFAVLAWNCLFTPIFWGFGGIFPPNMATHRSNPQKDHPWAETRRLSHKGWKSVKRFDLGAGSRKKGKDSPKKSHKVVTFRLFGEKPPTAPIETKICMVGHLADVITYAKFQDDFQGLRFYRGSNFPFSYWFLHGPYNSAARLRCLWL